MSLPVTVLMAVHNGAPFLSTSLESILNQTYRDFRFMIVDDASTDKTREIIRSYQDDRLELICLEKNIGQTAALNYGLRQARNPWIARMDADDFSAPQRLEEQVHAAEAHSEVSCIGTGIWEFTEDPAVQETVVLRPEAYPDIRRAALLGSGMIHGSILVKRDALLSIGGYDERYRYASDRVMFIRLLSNHQALNIPKPLLGVRRHPGQDSFSLKAADEYVDLFSMFLSEDGFTPEEAGTLRQSLAYSYLFRADYFRREGRGRQRWQDVRQAFSVSPKVCFRNVAGSLSRQLMPVALRRRLQTRQLGVVYENR